MRLSLAVLIGFPDKETGWDESWRGRVPLRTAPGLTDIGGNAAPAPKVPLPFSYIRFSPSTMICPVRGVS